MVDVSAINSAICNLKRQPKDLINEYKRVRRISLENLALALIKYGIKCRIDVRSINNFSWIQSHIKSAIIKSGESLSKIQSPSPKKKLEKAQYCDLCNKKKEDPCENRKNTKLHVRYVQK
jgi:hypothetical protein